MMKKNVLKDLSNEIFAPPLETTDKNMESTTIDEIISIIENGNNNDLEKIEPLNVNQDIFPMDTLKENNNTIIEEELREDNSISNDVTSLNDIINEDEDDESSFASLANNLEEDLSDEVLDEEERELLLDNEDDEDVTFNDLNNRVQEESLLEADIMEPEECEDKASAEERIVSSFPKLDKFGSVIPVKKF